MGNTAENRKIPPEQLLAKLRKEERRIVWEEKKAQRDEESFWGRSTLKDSYLRVAGSLLVIILFLYFTTLFAIPLLLLIHKIYPPAATPYVIYPTFILIGYGLWRFIKWAD